MHSPPQSVTPLFFHISVSFMERPGGVPALSTEPPCSFLAVLTVSHPFSNLICFNCHVGKGLIFSRSILFVCGQWWIILKVKVMLRHENRPSPEQDSEKVYSDCFYSRLKEHLWSHCFNILFYPQNPFLRAVGESPTSPSRKHTQHVGTPLFN